MENPPFWWYLPGKMGIFMGYVSLPEGRKTNIQICASSTSTASKPNICGGGRWKNQGFFREGQTTLSKTVKKIKNQPKWVAGRSIPHAIKCMLYKMKTQKAMWIWKWVEPVAIRWTDGQVPIRWIFCTFHFPNCWCWAHHADIEGVPHLSWKSKGTPQSHPPGNRWLIVP